MSAGYEPVEHHFFMDGHSIELELQDLTPSGFIRQGDVDDTIQTAGSKQSLVDHIWPIGGRHNRHVFERLDAVHFGEELGQDSVAHAGRSAAAATASCRSQRVQLVEKDDGWRYLTSPPEDFSDSSFRFAHPFAEQFRALKHNSGSLQGRNSWA